METVIEISNLYNSNVSSKANIGYMYDFKNLKKLNVEKFAHFCFDLDLTAQRF